MLDKCVSQLGHGTAFAPGIANQLHATMHEFSAACAFTHQHTMTRHASFAFAFAIPAAAIGPCARNDDHTPAFFRANDQSWHSIIDEFIFCVESQALDC